MANENTVIINDVGPRDGLQNQKKILTAAQRLQIIEALIEAGLPAIEVGSFVSPKAVPAMAGTDEVVHGLLSSSDPAKSQAAVDYTALIPNLKGYEMATANGITAVTVVVAASESMNLENVNQTNEQAMAGFKTITERAISEGVDSFGCLATSWECPFEGLVDQDVVFRMTEEMLEAGAKRVVLADTIGAANPGAVHDLLNRVVQRFGAEKFACHFHDTRGLGAANAYAAYTTGVRYFDASVGGLGGCPFAPGASGNVATEDLALMFSNMGCDTGIDLTKLMRASALVGELVELPTGGHCARWLNRQIEKQAV